MTFPKVSDVCVMATLSKLTQTHPKEFAVEMMSDLVENQPALMAAITELLLVSAGEDIEAMEGQLTATFCILGLFSKAVTAQIEADELNEAWGE